MTDTLKPYTPSLRDRLRYALMGDSHDSTRAHFVNGLLKQGGLLDFTPVGIPLNAYDAGRYGAQGQYVNSLLSGIAAIPALGPLAGKIAGGVKEARAARMAGDFKTNAFRVADEHANEVTDILAQAHAGANLRSPLPEPASKNMNIEDIIGPRIDQLGTPSKGTGNAPDLAKDEIWGAPAAQQPAAPKVDLSRRGFLGMGAGAAVASAIGLPHFMKPAAEAIQAAAPALEEAGPSIVMQHLRAYHAHSEAAQAHHDIFDVFSKFDGGEGEGEEIDGGVAALQKEVDKSRAASKAAADATHDLMGGWQNEDKMAGLDEQHPEYTQLREAAQSADRAVAHADYLHNDEIPPEEVWDNAMDQEDAHSGAEMFHGDAANAHLRAAYAHDPEGTIRKLQTYNAAEEGKTAPLTELQARVLGLSTRP